MINTETLIRLLEFRTLEIVTNKKGVFDDVPLSASTFVMSAAID